jgi:hypothetical protein
VDRIHKISLDAEPAMNPDQEIQEQCLELFNADRLTPEKIGAVMVEAGEHPKCVQESSYSPS